MVAQVIQMQAQLRSLVDQELYVSAEKLGAFLMCSANPELPTTGPGSHTESLTLYADALFGKGEYQRALSYYKQAMQRRKVGPHMMDVVSSLPPHGVGGRRSPGTRGSPNSSNRRSGSPQQVPSPLSFSAVSCPEEAMLKFKEGRCLVALEDTSAAIRTLESVPNHLRSLRLHLLLGGAYVSTGSGNKLGAVRCYKEAARLDPLALEACQRLVELGVEAAEVLRIMRSSPSTSTSQTLKSSNNAQTSQLASSSPPSSSSSSSFSATGGQGAMAGGGVVVAGLERGGWVEEYVHGLAGSFVDDQQIVTYQAWTRLEQRFPNNLHSLLNLGTLHLSADRLDDAHYYFTKARVCDTLCLDLMDHFALLVKLRLQSLGGGDGGDALSRTSPGQAGGVGSSTLNASQGAGASSGAELNRLAHDLLDIDPKRPEPWVAVALYHELRGDKEKSLTHLDRAITMSCASSAALLIGRGGMGGIGGAGAGGGDGGSGSGSPGSGGSGRGSGGGGDGSGSGAKSGCYCLLHPSSQALLQCLRGGALLALQRPEPAIMAFFKAKEKRKELRAYQGLVDSYLAVRKLREALVVAKECNQVPSLRASAGAVCLLARVLGSPQTQPSDKDRAKQLYARALDIDPACVHASLALVELNLLDSSDSSSHAKCVTLLQAALEKACYGGYSTMHQSAQATSSPSMHQDALHAKLADVLTLMGKPADALAHYHTALSLHPNNAEAKTGLERLEKVMRGVDPDCTNEDGELDEDVAEQSHNNNSGDLEGSPTGDGSMEGGGGGQYI